MKPALIGLAALSAIAADVPLPAFRIEVDGDGCRAYVKNVHSSPLTAFWLEQVGYPGTRWSSRRESLGPDAIPAGTEVNFWFKNQAVCASPAYVKMLAAVYEDGSSAGDAEEIARVIGARRQTLLNIREAIRRIQAAIAEGKPRPAIIDAITAWGDSIGPERRAGIQIAVKLLQEISVDGTIAKLQEGERILAASKPALE